MLFCPISQCRFFAGPDIPRNRIIIGGFSQGGAVALSTLFRNPDVAGCLALSTYMPGNKAPAPVLQSQGEEDEVVSFQRGKIDTPILQCHGEEDEVISFQRGKLTHEILTSLANNVEFKAFRGMGHENNMEEMQVVTQFIKDRLGRS